MRLTLRTLLAYLDHVLDSSDAKELESKIRESQLARHTMERIDKGLASQATTQAASTQDPNLLADYLDNTLPPEEVPQFERQCFEGDAQLVEAAAVHRILSVVVTRPIHVSDSLKERLKNLVSSSAIATPNRTQQPAGTVATNGELVAATNGHVANQELLAAPLVASLDAQSRPAPQINPHGLDMSARHINTVPEYLRDRSYTTYLQVAGAAVLLVAIGFIAWKSIGPFDELSNMFRSQSSELAQVEKSDTPTAKSTPEKAVIVDTVAPPAVEKMKTVEVTPKAPEPAAETVTTEVIESNVAPPVVKVPDAAATESVIVEESVTPPPAPNSNSVASVTPTITESTIVEGVVTTDVAPPTPSDIPPVPEATAKSAITWQPETKESTSAVVMAATLDKEQNKSVRLVNIAEHLAAAERLIVPDSYRTELRIEPGLKWVVSSATDLQGESGDDPSTAYVRLRLGRALLHATADCSKLVLRVANQEFRIVMDSPTAVASLEVRYFPRVGTRIDAEEIAKMSLSNSHPVPNFLFPIISVGSIAGNVQVQTKKGVSWSDPITAEAGSVVAFIDGQSRGPHTLSEVPWWYRTSIERPIDAGAANDLALELQTVTPAPATTDEAAAVADTTKKENLIDILKQSTHARRSETAALAARTLALLGQYDSIFGKDAVMSQNSARPHRTLILDTVIQSLGIGPVNADNLIKVMNEYDPPRGTRLLAILSLPSAAELTKPDGAQPYIDALSSSYLDERAVAIYQLTKITGKEFTYQADRVTSESLSQWRKIHNAGRIEWSDASVKPLEWDVNQ